MGRNRFVKPQLVRLPLSDGDWVDVKRQLNAGETRAIFTDMIKEQHAGEVATIDTTRVGITKLLAYIVEWSFTDDNGPVAFSEAALANLDMETFKELTDAVDAHEARVEQEQEQKKISTATTSSVTSPSVDS